MEKEITIKKEKLIKKPMVQSTVGVLLIFITLGIFIFWQTNKNTIYIENSDIEAPIIYLSGGTAGTLNALYVKEGDKIEANTPVALVGTDIVTAKQSGMIIEVKNNIGTYYTPGQTVVSMIHSEDMKLIGTIDENKGLDQIKSGDKVIFTVDTFGNKKYAGIVESISSTSNDTGVIFSISDKRPIKKFDVKINFNVTKYPELKNGMSAKATIFTK